MDRSGRLELLRKRTRRLELDDDLDLELVAARTRGLSAPDIRKLVDEACRFRALREAVQLNQDDFTQALRAMELSVGGRLVMSDRECSRLAYSEAGRALIGLLQPGADCTVRASVFSTARIRRRAMIASDGGHRLRGEASRRARIIGLLAGETAVRMAFDEPGDEGRSDRDEAGVLARGYLAHRPSGNGDAFAAAVPPLISLDPVERAARHECRTPAPAGSTARETHRTLYESERRAEELLREHREALDSLAGALLARETLDQGEIAALAHPRPDAGRGTIAALEEVPHRSVAVMSRAQHLRYLGLAGLWVAVSVGFWLWWLGAGSAGAPWLYWLQTVMLFYQVTLLPTIYWMFVGRMRRPVEIPAPPGVKVAMVTLCVPSHESLAVITAQLDALREVTYPHDSWVLDEGNSAAVRRLARERGVKYFSRKGIASWNEPAPPFQISTKAGNVNAWLDHVASLGLHYEVFVQLDVDHHPRPDYLDRTLGYFRDPSVAWVQAPSVVGNVENWAARGLAEQDLLFHGPLQMGFYGHSRTPFIIGSHTTYRTAAVREIGGFQPTRAEDHLDTVVLGADGYTGVFVPDLIAVGDGPDDFATYLRQQFAWAYSMIQIFVRHTPRLIRQYSFRQACQFLFCQSWYTMWSVSLAVLWLLPTVALVIREPIASVKLSQYLIYFAPLILASGLMWCETRKWFQPGGVRLSWRGILLGVARWPVVLWAFINVVLRIKRPYMITPKGVASAGPPSLGLYGPGLGLAAVPLMALWGFQLSGGGGPVEGYCLLALLNAALGLVLVITTVGLEIRAAAAGADRRTTIRRRTGVIAASGLLLVSLVVSTVLVWQPMVQAIS
ncbi:MAG TPA: glycosyltransferase family 2 protein [Solirubrobacteraceae bacterium]